MMNTEEPTSLEMLFGDLAPVFVGMPDTSGAPGQVWAREGLSSRERSLITLASLATSGAREQLGFHVGLARSNGLSKAELVEVMAHLAFYIGGPKAVSAIMVARDVFAQETDCHRGND
ncbi:MAG: carboxymuconolactone decarboxylase family protein [Acidimicrobiales bacterium]